MTKIRVLVVEDSPTVRRVLCDVLGREPDLEVVGEAEDGQQAIELCQQRRPNVVTMDMVMPVTTGLAATEYIMAHCPTPIVICSSSVNRGDLFHTYDALAAGAVDVIEKPTGREEDRAWEQRFVETVKLVSRIRVITHPRARLRPPAHADSPAAAPTPIGVRPSCQVIALGASTGGPAAIVEVLRALPPDFRIPVLLVLHINEPFGAAFAEWLAGQINRPVAYARHGEALASTSGTVAMAPPDQHLLVRDGRLILNRDPERHSCRPSVDVLFESVAQAAGAATAGCLLTGMGRDGAAGLLAIRRAGGLTIAQDEATSVVFGMPREAARLGAAVRVLPLGAIGTVLASLAETRRGVSP